MRSCYLGHDCKHQLISTDEIRPTIIITAILWYLEKSIFNSFINADQVFFPNPTGLTAY